MTEELVVNQALSKPEQYKALLPQLSALVEGEDDITANVANIMAALMGTFPYLWVGVYWVRDKELVLGPFQGPVACTRIAHGQGVCGSSWSSNKTILVDDVDEFPGHIACSNLSKSEIVIPGRDKNNKVVFVLDVDHQDAAWFNSADEEGLGDVVHIIESLLR